MWPLTEPLRILRVVLISYHVFLVPSLIFRFLDLSLSLLVTRRYGIREILKFSKYHGVSAQPSPPNKQISRPSCLVVWSGHGLARQLMAILLGEFVLSHPFASHRIDFSSMWSLVSAGRVFGYVFKWVHCFQFPCRLSEFLQRVSNPRSFFHGATSHPLQSYGSPSRFQCSSFREAIDRGEGQSREHSKASQQVLSQHDGNDAEESPR